MYLINYLEIRIKWLDQIKMVKEEEREGGKKEWMEEESDKTSKNA